MEDVWEFPSEVQPHVAESSLTQKRVTTPRLLVEPVTPREQNEETPSKRLTSPRNGSAANDSFRWLVVELVRAHEREVQEALATWPVPLSARSLVSSTSPHPSLTGDDAILDGVGIAMSPRHVRQEQNQHQHNLVHVAPAGAAVLEGASRSNSPEISIHPKASSLRHDLLGAHGIQEERQEHAPLRDDKLGVHGGMRSQEVGPSDSRPSSTATNSKQLKLKGSTHAIREAEHANFFSRLGSLLNSEGFALVMALVIMLNILVMGCELQYTGLEVGFNLHFPGRAQKARTVWGGADTTFSICDWFFGILFFLEMLVKIACFRTKYWYDPGPVDPGSENPEESKLSCARFFMGLQVFNIVDFSCVVAFFFDKISEISADDINPQMIRMVRLFRLSRVVRLLRFLESLDHLYVMTTAISSLASVLAWAVILLTVMLIVCDLLLVQALQMTYFNDTMVSDLSEDQLKKHHEMYAYFGTCTRCMLSMFEITLGNWPPVARLLTEEVSQWFTLLCIMHKLTVGFAVVGVINGVMLQETFKVAQQDDIIMLRQKQKATRIHRGKMEALFNTLDTEKDGKLSESEFAAIKNKDEIKAWLSSQNIETDDLETLFTLLDDDGSGYITLEELFTRMPRIAGAARSIDMLKMRKRLTQEFYPQSFIRSVDPS